MYLIRHEDLGPTQIPAGTGTRFVLPAAVGEGFTRHWSMERDLDILETRYHPYRDFAYDSLMQADARVLVMTFAVEGNSAFIAKGGGELPYRQGYTTIATFHRSAGQRRYFAGGTTHQVRILAGETWLKSQLGESAAQALFRSGGLEVLARNPTSALAASSVRSLLCLQAEDANTRLLRRGLVLTALAGELARIKRPSTHEVPAAPGLRQLSQVRRACELLEREIAAPPTIRMLARRVGTSEKVLKAGFRAIHGTTPGGWLLDLRMRKAWGLLSETGCHVATAGYAVGYRFPGNFSAAFTRHFGIAPKEVKAMRPPMAVSAVLSAPHRQRNTGQTTFP